MTHLGTALSALADGQLDPVATERALAHVAGCASCAEELAAARAARAALLAALEVRPDPALTARLLAMAAPSPEPNGRGEPALGVGSVPLPGTTERWPVGCLRGELPRRRAPWTVLAIAGSGLAALAATLFVLGDQASVVPHRHPAYALTVLARAGQAVDQVGADRLDTGAPTAATLAPGTAAVGATSRGSAAVGVAAVGAAPGAAAVGAGADGAAADAPTDLGDQAVDWVARHRWAAPLRVPTGYTAAAVRLVEDGELEVDLVGPQGLVVLTQWHGRLDTSALGEPDLVAGRPVHVLCTAPWHAVWQEGDVVLSVVAEVPQAAIELVGAYPAVANDDGVPARLVRGWQTMAGAWTRP